MGIESCELYAPGRSGPCLASDPLPIADLRCPETGSRLALDSDGDTLVSAEDRRYGRISGIRSFWTRPQIDVLQQHYDTAGGTEDFSFRSVNYLSKAVFDRLQGIFQAFMPPDLKGMRCLDVGCGHGGFSESWARQTEVIGLDFSIAMLRMAQKLGLEVYHGDATRLPFRDGLFDVVICASVLQVLSERARLVRELVRVTKPGGLVLLSTLNGDALVRRAFRLLMRARIYRRSDIPLSTLPTLLPADTVPQLVRGLPCRIERVAATMHPLQTVRYSDQLPGLARVLEDSFVFKIRRTDGPNS